MRLSLIHISEPTRLGMISYAVFCLKKNHTNTSYVVCTQVRRHVYKQITKRRYGYEKPYHKKKIRGRKARTFCFRKTSFVHSQSGTYSLGIFVWNFYQTFFIVSIEFWLRFQPQIHPTGFAIYFLFITVRAERKVHLCVKLFYFLPRWILIRLTWYLCQFVPYSVDILTLNFSKKLFRMNFSEMLCKPRLSFTKICEISPHFLQFLFWVHTALKNSENIHISTFICCLHPSKEARP